jgi:hypothetical protein
VDGWEGPRAVGRPSPALLWLKVLAAVLLLSLPTLPAALVAGWVIRWRGWRPWLVVAGAVVVLAVEVLVVRERLAAWHFAGWREHGLGVFQQGPGWWGRVLALWWARLVAEALVGVPLGVAAGALLVGRGEHQAAGAPWHPAERRRQQRRERQTDRRVARTVRNPRDGRCTGPALGVVRGGHLPGWVQGRYVVLPRLVAGQALLVAGMPSSGKTETLLRLAYDAGRRGMRLVFVDCKGTDPDLAARVLAAYRLGRGEGADPIRLRRWPAEPLDMWRGEPSHVHNRLMQLKSYDGPSWWEDVATVALRLALEAPGEPPCTSSRELLRRLDADWLAERWRGQPEEIDLEAAKANNGLAGVHLRYSSFFSSIAGGFDGGASFEDVDVLVMTLPTLVARRDAEAAVRVVLEDFAHHAAVRKPRHGDDVRLMIDEFSAVDGLAGQAVHLAERLRDVRGGVVLAAQSWEGLGGGWTARRLVGACAALILHRMPLPEALLEAAGLVEAPERSWRLDEWGSTGQASVSMQRRPLVDPQAVRHAATGEAWIVQPGHALRVQVLQVATSAQDVTDAFWALEGPIVGAERPPWGVDLPYAPADALGPLGTLVGGPLGELPAPSAPVPAVPSGPPTRLRLQLAAAVAEGDRPRALELARAGSVPAAELQAIEDARRLARLPLLLRLLAVATRHLVAITERAHPRRGAGKSNRSFVSDGPSSAP